VKSFFVLFQLFDYLVECLWDFLVKRDMMCQLLPIGFTFSFPTKHLGIDKVICYPASCVYFCVNSYDFVAVLNTLYFIAYALD